jgi:hypothetical protein
MKIENCPVQSCLNQDFCRHGEKFVGYCTLDYQAICEVCLDFHRDHPIRSLSDLDEDFNKELKCPFTNNYRIFNENFKVYQDFCEMFKKTQINFKKISNFIESCEKKIEEVNSAESFIGRINNFPNNIFEAENSGLNSRITVLRYLKTKDNFKQELVETSQKMEELNKSFEDHK